MIENPTDEQFFALSNEVDALLLKYENLGWQPDHIILAVMICVASVAIASSRVPDGTIKRLHATIDQVAQRKEDLQKRGIKK